MTKVSDMVNSFLQAEDKNFSLFNFVNDLNRQDYTCVQHCWRCNPTNFSTELTTINNSKRIGMAASLPCLNFRVSVFSEIERLEVMIAEKKNSIEKVKGQGVSTDSQRKKVLRGLEEELAATEVLSS